MSNYWIQTFTGKLFDLESPTEDMICIEDIAHHLSIENRWHGATKFPISVGYHSILVSQFLPDYLKLEGLLHDAEEAYYKDFANPWKRLIKSNLSSNLWERCIDWCMGEIINKFNLTTPEENWKTVKDIDLRMVITERNQICAPAPDKYLPEYENAEPLPIVFLNLSPKNVEELFLEEFYRLERK